MAVMLIRRQLADHIPPLEFREARYGSRAAVPMTVRQGLPLDAKQT